MWRASLLAALTVMAGTLGYAQQETVSATAELRAAIDLLKTHHIYRDRIDWPSVESEAFGRVGGGRKATDAYPAIRYVIAQLHEKHTHLIEADQWQADMSGRAVGDKRPLTPASPQTRALDSDTGYVAIPAFLGAEDAIATYIAGLRSGIERLKRHGTCRFVIDLRGNMGGNMWPMLNGLTALLGNPPYGYFETDNAISSTWAPRNGEILPLDGSVAVAAPLRDEDLSPIAVLIDRKTMSSGEFVAMAFRGRAHTRFFGERSGGYVSVNDLYTLPDGARLALAVGFAQDRLHRRYDTALVPDEETSPGDATLASAASWLSKQPCALAN